MRLTSLFAKLWFSSASGSARCHLRACEGISNCFCSGLRKQPATAPATRRLWNKGKLAGPKPPLPPKHVWAIRTRLQMQRNVLDLVLFNLAIDSKLRAVMW